MENMMKVLYDALLEGKDAVLATVVAASGSTPRGAGARMVVTREKAAGTIGGGLVEYKTQQLASELLTEKKSRLEKFRLTPQEAAGLGMLCGGNMDVYLQYFSGSDERLKTFLQGLTKAVAAGRKEWLATRLVEEGEWDMFLSSQQPEPSADYYAEPLEEEGLIYIFGGGHVAQQLSPVLAHIGYKHVVADDRPEFCRPEIFPGAQAALVVDLGKLGEAVTVSPADYVVIMTRGHQHDLEALAQMLKTPAAYIGMIGSRAKIAKTYEKLRERGFTQEDFDRVHAPIGISIGAETPEEIAVSIAAELIRVRRGQK